MKELIREILKENLSDINTDKGELKRKIGFKTIGQNTLKDYIDRGYKPYYIKQTSIHEIPFKDGLDLENKWGWIYFFNDKEMKILNKVSNNITEIKGELKKQIDLYNKYLLSFIETSGII